MMLIAVIDLTSVADFDHADDQPPIINGIDDSVRTDPEAEKIGVTFQLLDISMIGKGVDRSQNAALLVGRLLLDKFEGGFFVDDLITHKTIPNSLQTSSSVKNCPRSGSFR